ncbi:MAG: phosphotransferase, partial [Brachybacterium sp.]|nr:phosphotransferase [Brachybacterium sp.]
MLSPGLSMLWESVDAEQALRDRFGLEGTDHAADWLTAILAEHWSLAVQEVPRLPLSDRSPLSLAVLPEVAGNWLDGADLGAVHAAGAGLATLHEALHDVAEDARSDSAAAALTTTAPRPLPERVSGWLAGRDPGRAPEASTRLAELLTALPAPSDAPQLIHGDFRAANLLVRDAQIAAVLDFDDVRTDHRVADLAQAGTYLVTLFRHWGPTPAPARAALRAGYEAVR